LIELIFGMGCFVEEVALDGRLEVDGKKEGEEVVHAGEVEAAESVREERMDCRLNSVASPTKMSASVRMAMNDNAPVEEMTCMTL